MYLFNFHIEPLPTSDKYGECIGAYAAIYINYKEYDGAMELAKFYVQSNDWKILNIEEDYWKFESEEDVEESKLSYYNEALESGYSIVFDTYENEDE